MKRISIVCALIAAMALLTLHTESYALDINRKVLNNGLTVLHVEKHNLPLVVVTLLVKTGQIDEPADKAGLANLASMLLTEGTQRRSSQEISEEADFIGAKLGVAPGADFTTISLSVLKKDVKIGFDLMSDILLNPSFPQIEIERAKLLVKGGLRQREEDPSFIASRAFIKEVFGEHPYGHVIQGTPETIDTITRDEIVGYYSKYYVPNNSILCVAGDITSKELDELIKSYLGSWVSKPLTASVRPSVARAGKKVVLIDKDLTQANIILGHLGVRRDNPDYYALSVMNYILGGGGFSSRLMAKVRDEMGLAYSIYSQFSSDMEAGTFIAGVETKNASARTVIDEIIRQINSIRETGVTDKELEEAKAFLIGSFPRRLDTMRKVADFISQIEFFGLGLDYQETYAKRVRSVTREDILRVARTYLDSDNYVLVVVAKQSEAGLKE